MCTGFDQEAESQEVTDSSEVAELVTGLPRP